MHKCGHCWLKVLESTVTFFHVTTSILPLFFIIHKRSSGSFQLAGVEWRTWTPETPQHSAGAVLHRTATSLCRRQKTTILRSNQRAAEKKNTTFSSQKVPTDQSKCKYAPASMFAFVRACVAFWDCGHCPTVGANRGAVALHCRWSKDEDALLRKAVEVQGMKSWKRIAEEFFPHKRTEQQVQYRWTKVRELSLPQVLISLPAG